MNTIGTSVIFGLAVFLSVSLFSAEAHTGKIAGGSICVFPATVAATVAGCFSGIMMYAIIESLLRYLLR